MPKYIVSQKLATKIVQKIIGLHCKQLEEVHINFLSADWHF